ncbi:hypothetical protein GLOIN_2v1611136 [Rhizophagus irregularis DAOM 181602=DAOM 197198]|uniref:Uncharacterized protein n=1 Tax=Rhizophagus irregularis (strain DAOM 181602 / DAOM 197198 / MUCL 43194) TaxID=747089 RepID=A0A2P4Q068_RHIID|nr:hypothetical protein GLOIN_2v1611136 [Rhizophagus irregularis DAOM 181602=DAOM 197198]POG71033.1 hypothetical protein GLOIN_2v1611136 [Rhizophagus irregularis DAOM 181602=DAOM 197198]|eukprot:XP_025177899.1 hypothetical protein GLOIN_2v1611136 [Rhizophagus irregularis DAOM 181602=DAOM 197198]
MLLVVLITLRQAIKHYFLNELCLVFDSERYCTCESNGELSSWKGSLRTSSSKFDISHESDPFLHVVWKLWVSSYFTKPTRKTRLYNLRKSFSCKITYFYC